MIGVAYCGVHYVSQKTYEQCAEMKCTYRLLVLIGTAFCLLLMLGLAGDISSILYFGNPRPSSVSQSLRLRSEQLNSSYSSDQPLKHGSMSNRDLPHQANSNYPYLERERPAAKPSIHRDFTNLDSQHPGITR